VTSTSSPTYTVWSVACYSSQVKCRSPRSSRPWPSPLWTSHPAPSLRPLRCSGRQPYRRRRRCNNWLTPFFAVRCARGSRASLSAPRRTISPKLPLSFFLDTSRPPLLVALLPKEALINHFALARFNLRRAACAPSKILQLYATSQGVVMAPGLQEPPTRGKSQLDQNVLCRVVHRNFREHSLSAIR
jgi:hypothetical protein